MVERWIPYALLLPLLALPACSGGSGTEDGGSADSGPPWEPQPITREVNAGDPQDPDLTLSVREVGGEADGARTVVLIHGGPGMSSIYLRDLEALASADLRIVTFDQRGVGTSGIPTASDGYARARIVADLEALRTELGVETFGLVGHSWGGYLAQAYAINHPTRVDALVLYSSIPADHVAFSEANARMMRKLSDLQAAGIIPDPLPGDPTEMFHAILPLYWHDPAFVPDWDLTDFVYHQAVGTEYWNQNLNTYDLSAELGALSGPTVHLLYGGSEPFGAQTGLDLLATMPIGTDYELLPECGHMSWVECPELAFPALRADLGIE